MISNKTKQKIFDKRLNVQPRLEYDDRVEWRLEMRQSYKFSQITKKPLEC